MTMEPGRWPNGQNIARSPYPPPLIQLLVLCYFLFDYINDMLMFNVSQPLDFRSMVSERDGSIFVESKLPEPEQNGNKN